MFLGRSSGSILSFLIHCNGEYMGSVQWSAIEKAYCAASHFISVCNGFYYYLFSFLNCEIKFISIF